MRQLYILFFYFLKTIISKNGNKTDPEINAYYLISFIQGINVLSIFNLLKVISKTINHIELSFLSHVIFFFVPPLVFNYFFFVRAQRYKILIEKISNEISSPKYYFVIISGYLILTIFLFGFSIWVNT
jgi:hypothetical protein